MIYLFTALYSEARIFIESFGLKKVMDSTRFQQFFNEAQKIRLTITGTGEIAAASAVSSVCTEHQPGKEDVLLNVGISGGHAPAGSLFLIHKLTEQATGKTFYPDILCRHDFSEAEVITGMQVWRSNGTGPDRAGLFDMEAAAVYQAGSYFFGPHQMFFLKIVSDHGDADAVSPQKTEQLMAQQKERIFAFLQVLLSVSAAWGGRAEKAGGTRPEGNPKEAWMKKLCADMHCSRTMEYTLRSYLRYLALAGMDGHAVVREMYKENRLPCRDKKEGKQCLEQLKKRILKLD